MGVSVRHLYRLIHDQGFPAIRIGKRRLAVLESDLREWLAGRRQVGHTEDATGSVARRETKPCHTDAKIRLSGGRPTPTQAAKELEELLGLRTKGRR